MSSDQQRVLPTFPTVFFGTVLLVAWAAFFSRLPKPTRRRILFATIAVVSVIELIATAEDADRQHAGRVDHFPRHVDRQVADGLAVFACLLPLPDGAEVQVFIKILAALDDLFQGHSGNFRIKW